MSSLPWEFPVWQTGFQDHYASNISLIIEKLQWTLDIPPSQNFISLLQTFQNWWQKYISEQIDAGFHTSVFVVMINYVTTFVKVDADRRKDIKWINWLSVKNELQLWLKNEILAYRSKLDIKRKLFKDFGVFYITISCSPGDFKYYKSPKWQL